MASPEAIKFVGLITNWGVARQADITAAMQTKAQWEIWLQVELAIHMKKSADCVIREQKYDASRKSLDILTKVGTRALAIELKAESMQTGLTSGKTMIQSLMLDKAKLMKHPLASAVSSMGCTALSSFVIGIGDAATYTVTATEVMKHGESLSLKVGPVALYGMLME